MKKIIFLFLLGSVIVQSTNATASYYQQSNSCYQSNTITINQQNNVFIPSMIEVEKDPYEICFESLGDGLAQALDYHFAKKAVKKYLENPTVENYLEASKYVDLPKLLDAIHKAEEAIKQQKEHNAKLFLKHLKKILPANVPVNEFVISTRQQYQTALKIVQESLRTAKKTDWLIEGSQSRQFMNQLSQQYCQISHKNPYLSFKDKPFPEFAHLNEYVKTRQLFTKKIKYFEISPSNQKSIVKQLKSLENTLSNEMAFLQGVVNTQTFAEYIHKNS